MSKGVSVFNASVDYEYVFRDANGDFKVPCFDFPIFFSTNESVEALLYDLLKLYRFCLKNGDVEPFFQSLEYLSHNANFLKKILVEQKEEDIQKLLKLFPEEMRDELREAVICIKLQTVRKLSHLEKDDQTAFYNFVLRYPRQFSRYAKTLSPIEGAASTPASVKRIMPIIGRRSDLSSIINWNIETPKELKYAIKLCGMIQAYPKDVFDNLVRHLMCHVFSDKIKNSAASYYLFLKNPSLKYVMTDEVIKRIFSQDYDLGYCSSSIARRLYIGYAAEGGVSRTDARSIKEAMNLVKSGKRIGNLFEIIYAHKDDYDADELFATAYLKNIDNVESFLCETLFAVKGSAINTIPMASCIMSEKKGIHGMNSLYDFLGTLGSLGFETSEEYNVFESLMGNLPIFTGARNDLEKDVIRAIFSSKHKSVHTNNLYDFYKNINPYVRALSHMRKYPCFSGGSPIAEKAKK